MTLSVSARPGARPLPARAARRPAGAARRALAPRAAASADFSPDQLQAFLSRQVQKSQAQRSAAPSEARPAESMLPKRKTSRREARAAAAAAEAEAAVAARQQSHATQKSLKDRVALMEERALAAALAAQLRQSGTFDESDLPATNGNGNGSAAHHAAKGNGAGSDGVRHEAGGAHGHAAHVEAGVAAEAGGVVFTF